MAPPHCPIGLSDPRQRELFPGAHGYPVATFRVLDKARAMEYCVPTKCGFAHTDVLLGYLVSRQMGARACGKVCRCILAGTACHMPNATERANIQVRSYIQVRNPYERLLSAYLGQVAAPADGIEFDHNAKALLVLSFGPSAERACSRLPCPGNGGKPCNQSKSCPTRYGAFAPTPSGFADFVRQLTRPNATVGNHFARDHLLPITSSPKPCLTPEYRALVTNSRPEAVVGLAEYYHVHKLELQAAWYPAWVRDNQMERHVTDSKWKQGCFWKRPNASCSETLRAATSQVDVTSRSCNPTQQHNTGACGQLAAFYTRELADAVSRYAARDLEEFGYPRWTPSADTPYPSAGTNHQALWNVTSTPRASLPFAPCKCVVPTNCNIQYTTRT